MVKTQSNKYNNFLMEQYNFQEGKQGNCYWLRFNFYQNSLVDQLKFQYQVGINISVTLQIKKKCWGKDRNQCLRSWLSGDYQYRYFYKIKEAFILETNSFGNPSSFLQFIKDNIKKFDFSNITQIKFDDLDSSFCFELLFRQHFDPVDLLYQSFFAAKVIQLIHDMENQTLLWKSCKKFIQSLSFNFHHKQDNQIVFKAIQKAKQQFKGHFDFGSEHHHSYNKKVFNQIRFKEAAFHQQYFKYHPTTTTSEIFRLAAELGDNNNIYIHGQGGTGKSISFSLLVTLHNYIEKLKINIHKSKYYQFTSSNFKQGQFQNFPKYFYYSLNQDTDNLKTFLDIIQEQLPYDLKNKKGSRLPLVSQLQKIQEYYKSKGIKVIYLFDQINQYYSLVRKYQQKVDSDRKEQIERISKFLQQLQSKSIIYGSSQNLQTSLVEDDTWFSFKKYDVKGKKIQYQARLLKQNGLKEMIQIIQFQILNRTLKKDYRKNNINSIINKKKLQFEQLYKSFYFSALTIQNFYFLSQLTHQRVKKYFTEEEDGLQTIQYPFFNTQQQYYTMIHQIFLSLFRSLHTHAILSQSKKYDRFISNGTYQLQFDKYKQVTKIRAYASQISRQNQQNKFISSFIYQIKKTDKLSSDYIQLFRQHAQIIEGNRLKIFYSPQTYLKMTQFLINKLDFIQQYLAQFVNEQSGTMSWIDTTFDNCHVHIFVRNNLYLTINQLLHVKYSMEPYASFEAFTEFLTYQQKTTNKLEKQISMRTSIFLRFQELFAILFENKNQYQGQYLCAAPNKSNPDPSNLDNFQSTNSQAIDLLLISNDKAQKYEQPMDLEEIPSQQQWGKIIEQRYILRTFDFCVSFNSQQIQKKKKKAQLFFKKFIQIAQEQNTYKGVRQVCNLVQLRNKDVQRFNKKSRTRKKSIEMKRKYKMASKYKFKQIVHTIIAPKRTHNSETYSVVNYPQLKISLSPLQKMQYCFEDPNKIKLDSESRLFKNTYLDISKALMKWFNQKQQ